MTDIITSDQIIVIENNVPLADSRQIAQQLGVKHENFFGLIADHQEEIEDAFEVIRFETALPPKGSKGGQPQKYALLTETQTYVLVTYAKNTDQARACKRMLVKAFAEAKQLVATQRIALQEVLTELATRLNNLPQGLDATEIDNADMAVTRIRQTIAQVKAFLAEASKKKRINSDESGDLARMLSSIDAHMHQLFEAVQKDLTLDEQLTTLLFEYRDALPSQHAQKLLA